MKNNYILAINDDKDFTDAIVDYLEKEKFSIIMAPNRDIAFKHIEIKKPDLILLDIQMRAGTGLEVCRILKAQPSTADIPVIVYSVNSSLINMMASYLAGANRYIGRPFELNELMECVQNVLRQQDNRNSNTISMNGNIGCRT